MHIASCWHACVDLLLQDEGAMFNMYPWSSSQFVWPCTIMLLHSLFLYSFLVTMVDKVYNKDDGSVKYDSQEKGNDNSN